MASRQARVVLRFIRQLASARGPSGLPDQELLEQFLLRRDEAAFATLVQRHGPLVLGVCRRALHHEQDAEDAFQATFLVLVRKAGSIARRESVGSWLYGVASRIAQKARAQTARRRARETPLQDLAAPLRPSGLEWLAFGPGLDEEVNQLPDKYRLPLVLCYLEGKTTAEAARQLGCARGTVLSRLARARERLRQRLAGRGLALPAVAAGLGLLHGTRACAVPVALADSTVKAALALAVGGAAGGLISAPAAVLAKGAMQAMLLTQLRVMGAVLLAASVLGAGAGWLTQHVWAANVGDETGPHLIAGDPNALRLPDAAAAKLGVQTGEARPRGAPRPRLLKLTGTTAFDPQRLARLRSRVTGEILEVGDVRSGSRVKKGELLAVLWSTELAEKKSRLVDDLVQLRLDQEILDRAQKAADAVPEVFLLNARRNVQADSNATRRAEQALSARGLSDEDLKVVRDYAAGLAKGKEKRDRAKEKSWARAEVRAPQDGIIVESNVALHEILVAPSAPLFTLADLSRLQVVAKANKDDLLSLQALTPAQRRWVIRPAGADGQPVEGRIEQIGYLIDPNQHTAVVTGTVPNPEGRLRAGQFITATIALPAVLRELAVPTSALVESGRETIVFLQTDPAKPVYVQRRVVVVRRGQDTAHVRFALKPGERVVTAGSLDLKATLDDLKAEQK